MKNLILSIVFVFASFTMVNANSIESKISMDEIIDIEEQITVNYQVISLSENAPDSVKCWIFKKWVRRQANAVSDDQELIDEVVDALGDLCELANDYGLLD